MKKPINIDELCGEIVGITIDNPNFFDQCSKIKDKILEYTAEQANKNLTKPDASEQLLDFLTWYAKRFKLTFTDKYKQQIMDEFENQQVNKNLVQPDVSGSVHCELFEFQRQENKCEKQCEYCKQIEEVMK